MLGLQPEQAGSLTAAMQNLLAADAPSVRANVPQST